MTSTLRAIPRLPMPLNDRPQDLFLLAKGHYDAVPGAHRQHVESARRVVAFHNLYDIQRMGLVDTAHVVITDLMPLLKDTLSGSRLTDFLIRLGPDRLGLHHGNHADGYYAGLIESVLSQVCNLRVRDEAGQWLPPIKYASPDLAVMKLVACDDPAHFSFQRAPATDAA